MNAIVLVPLKRKGETFVMKVDYADWENLKQYNWHITKGGYVVRQKKFKGIPKAFYFHRDLMNPPSDMFVDHKNGDKLDNRRENLRLCNNSQNLANKGKIRSNTSGFKGVSWSKLWNYYEAYIQVDGKKKHLGCYTCALRAASVYNDAATKYFGEFAFLNKFSS